MRIHRLQQHGVCARLPDDVDLDFDALGPGLIALVGPPGSGKSHILEGMITATLFRMYAGYPVGRQGESFVSHVPLGQKRASTTLVFSMGGRMFRARVIADSTLRKGAGKTEAYLEELDPTTRETIAALAGPNTTDVDQVIATILPPLPALLASVAQMQRGDHGLFSLGPAEAKALFARWYGLHRLQEQSEAAKGWGDALQTRLVLVRERLSDARTRQTRATQLQTEVEALAEPLRACGTTVETARADDAAARAALRTAQDALGRAEADAAGTTRERARLTAERDAAQERVDAQVKRLEQLDADLQDARAVHAAHAALPGLDAELAAARETERAAAEALGPVAEEVGGLAATRKTLLEDAERAQGELREAQAAAARLAGLAEQETTLATKRTELARVTAQLDACSATLAGLQEAADAEVGRFSRRAELRARREPLAQQEATLAAIPGVEACRTCPLAGDAGNAATTLREIDAELATLPQDNARPAADRVRAERTRAEALGDQRSTLQAAVDAAAAVVSGGAADRAGAETEATRQAAFDDIVARGKRVRAQLDDATTRRGALAEQAAQATTTRTELETRRETAADTAQRLPDVRATETQREEAARAKAAAETAVTAAGTALAALPTVDLAAPQAAVAEAEADGARTAAALETAEATLATRREEQARLQGERTGLGEPDADVARLEAEERTRARDLTRWRFLQQSLGRDGLQARKLELATPEIESLANELLWTWTSDFSLALLTQEQTKTGELRETFAPRIINNRDGGKVQRMGSGGEQQAAEVAVRLAMAVANATRSGEALETLWLDESFSNMSGEFANANIAMLRKAIALGRFYQIYLVSHAREAWEQADHRIFVRNGTVSVDVPIEEAA